MDKQQSGRARAADEPVRSSLDELGTRISAVLRLYPDRKAAARVANVSTDQLTRYAKGRSSPPFEAAARLASDRGVSLEWLATGEGPMMSADRTVSSDAAGEITPELVEQVALFWLLANEELQERRTPEDLAHTIAEQCKLMRGEERDVGFFLRSLKSAIEDFKRRRDASQPGREGSKTRA